MQQDYYSVLGVPLDATSEQIVQKYRELVKQYHPDKLQDNPLKHLAEEKLKQINIAYEVLGKPERRAQYDQQGKQGQQGNQDTKQQDMHSDFDRTEDFESCYDDQPHYSTHIPYRSCYKHFGKPAVATCHFCGKNLCQSCASMFTIVSCPECLSKSNAVYLKNVRWSVWKPVTLFVVVALIAFFAVTRYNIQDSLEIGLYILGIVWGWDILKNAAWATGAGFLINIPVGIVMLMVLLLFGWLIGLAVGGFKYIKLLLHYRETVKTVTEAEKYIRQFVNA